MSEGKVDYLEKGCRLQQASAFRKGSYIILKDKLCRVVDMSTSKTGKHGSAKVNFTAQDIFTGRKVQEFCPSTESLYTFDPTRSDWTIMNIEDKNLSLINDEGKTREDLTLPEDEELAKKILDAWNEHNGGDKEIVVQVLTALGQSHVVGFTVRDAQ